MKLLIGLSPPLPWAPSPLGANTFLSILFSKTLSPYSPLAVLIPSGYTVRVITASLNKPEITKCLLLDVISDTHLRHISEPDVLVRPFTSRGLCVRCGGGREENRTETFVCRKDKFLYEKKISILIVIADLEGFIQTIRSYLRTVNSIAGMATW